MTRCECADLSFEEVAREVRGCGRTLTDVTRATGCGGICTACIPDLEQYLATLPR
jgi:bacterioferritin-associated ferredoxin